MHDIKTTGADDCPHASQIYPGVFDELNSLVEIRPKVVQDFMAIREKFPCYGRVMKHIVRSFFSVMQLSKNSLILQRLSNDCILPLRFI